MIFVSKLKSNIKFYSRHYPFMRKFLAKIWHKGKWKAQQYYFRHNYPEVTLYSANYSFDQSIANKYRSQFGQDRIINKMLNIDQGFFVDVGANDPEFINNTFFFEKYRCWSGIAIEPLSIHATAWQKYRPNTLLVSCVVGDITGEAEFIHIEPESGWEDTLSGLKQKVREEDLNINHKIIKVPMRTLSSILTESGVVNIDLLSIDVEGSEMMVLRGLDFNSIRPKIILCENTAGLFGSEEIRNYLKDNEYRFFGRVWTADDIFIDEKYYDHINKNGYRV